MDEKMEKKLKAFWLIAIAQLNDSNEVLDFEIYPIGTDYCISFSEAGGSVFIYKMGPNGIYQVINDLSAECDETLRYVLGLLRE